MPEPMKLKVMIAAFSYGGNGGISAEHPDVRDWMLQTYLTAKKDPRISSIGHIDIADTPITMSRNRAVLEARANGADVLIMVDSDMSPDCEPDGKPFFDTAFDFLYKHYHKGPVVVGAPYCGPPPAECIYVFKWRTGRNDSATPDFKIDMFAREEAAVMAGISPVAALPTGLIMFDMRAFDLTDPKHLYDALIEDGTPKDQAKLIARPWFYYEYPDSNEAKKASTEDVTATRDISLVGMEKLGYECVFCAWDCWAGHWKPCCVKKPKVIMTDHIGGKYRQAYKDGYKSGERISYISVRHQIEPEGEVVGIKDRLLPDNPKAIENFAEFNKTNNGITMPIENDHRLNYFGVDEVAKAVEHGIDMNGSAKDRYILSRLVHKQIGAQSGKKVIVEVGCNEGVGSQIIANHLSTGSKLYCVDHWNGSPHDMTGNIIDRLGGSESLFNRFVNRMQHKIKDRIVESVTGDSVATASKWLPDRPQADMIYIDAGHTYDEVKADIAAWIPIVKPGGMLCGHDYCNAFPGVKQAVDELREKYTIHTEENMWWMNVPGESNGQAAA